MKSVSLIIWLGCLCQVSLSQHWQQVNQPGFENYYCIDTCNTDGASEALVRTQRSFLLKKLFKKWGKWFRDDCVECCQNSAGYAGGTAGDGDAKVVDPCGTNSYQNSNSYGTSTVYENSNGYDNSNSNYGKNNNAQSYDNNNNAQNYGNNGYGDKYTAPDIPKNPGYSQGYASSGSYSGTNSESNGYSSKEAYVDNVVAPVEPVIPSTPASSYPPSAPLYSQPEIPLIPAYTPPAFNYGPYYTRIYTTSVTYMLPPCSPPSYENDHNMRTCPELFSAYIGSTMTPSSPY